jgi:hypothetical protein
LSIKLDCYICFCVCVCAAGLKSKNFKERDAAMDQVTSAVQDLKEPSHTEAIMYLLNHTPKYNDTNFSVCKKTYAVAAEVGSLPIIYCLWGRAIDTSVCLHSLINSWRAIRPVSTATCVCCRCLICSTK